MPSINPTPTQVGTPTLDAPPPPLASPEVHRPEWRVTRAAFDPEALDCIAVRCNDCCGTGWTSVAYDCHHCGGIGELFEQQTVICDWCDEETPFELTPVLDWAGRHDAICHTCWQAAQNDPAGHGDAVLALEVA